MHIGEPKPNQRDPPSGASHRISCLYHWLPSSAASELGITIAGQHISKSRHPLPGPCSSHCKIGLVIATAGRRLATRCLVAMCNRLLVPRPASSGLSLIWLTWPKFLALLRSQAEATIKDGLAYLQDVTLAPAHTLPQPLVRGAHRQPGVPAALLRRQAPQSRRALATRPSRHSCTEAAWL